MKREENLSHALKERMDQLLVVLVLSLSAAEGPLMSSAITPSFR